MLPKNQGKELPEAVKSLNEEIFEATDRKFDLTNYIKGNTLKGEFQSFNLRNNVFVEAKYAIDDEARKKIQEILKRIPKDADPSLTNELKDILVRNILYIGSECERFSDINIEDEYVSLDKELESEFMSLIRTPKPTYADLLDTWEAHKPSVVFFSCHGDKFGLYLKDDDGKCKHYPTTTFQKFFQIRTKQTECVVLSACESIEPGKKLLEWVPTVIMINKKVNIGTASTFNKRFIKYLNDYSNLDSSIYERAFNSAYEYVCGESLPDSFSFVLEKSEIKP